MFSTKKIKRIVDEACIRTEKPFRGHLGASIIGHDCTRYIQYSFWWSKKTKHQGRIKRLLERGKQEEFKFEVWLRNAGLKTNTHDQYGNQFKVLALHGHFGGSMDGKATGFNAKNEFGLEFKTYNDARFKQLVKQGAQKSAFNYYVQCSVYGHLEGLKYFLFMALNKNTDELYYEWVKVNKDTALYALNRAKLIISNTDLPVRLNDNASWYQCKMCDYLDVCHNGAKPARNCRTCKHSTPKPIKTVDRSGLWTCEKSNSAITDTPHLGCKKYKMKKCLADNVR